MITMTLEAEDMRGMRDELLKAADAIVTDAVAEHENDRKIDAMYAPQVVPTPSVSEDAEEQEDQVPFPQSPATSAVPTSNGELDANGFPWDPRIHAESKTKTKAGLWKYRRNLEDAVKAQVESQLKGQQSLPPMGSPARTFEAPVANNVVAFTPPPVPAANVQSPFPVSQPAPVAPVVEPAPTVPVAPQSAVHAHTLETFKANLFPVIAQLTKEGKITPTYIAQIKTHFNIGELWEMNDAQQAELFNVLAGAKIIVAVQS